MLDPLLIFLDAGLTPSTIKGRDPDTDWDREVRSCRGDSVLEWGMFRRAVGRRVMKEATEESLRPYSQERAFPLSATGGWDVRRELL